MSGHERDLNRQDEVEALIRAAQTLGRRAGGAKPLPPLLFFTDPQRTRNPLAVVERLPAGSAVIFRAFGAADALDQARLLKAACVRRGALLLVGADEALALAVAADGLHLPERAMRDLPALRGRHPAWLLTVAAHGEAAARRAARAGADAAVVSAVFPSKSPSARSPMGVMRFTRLARRAGLPVYALGGVNGRNAFRLKRSGAVGLAAVEGLALDGLKT